MNKKIHEILLVIIFLSLLSFVYAEDTDADGLDDTWEINYFTNLTQIASGDPDTDSLNNLQEYNYNSSPISNDTDLDGYTDGLEIYYNTNLTDNSSFPTGSLNKITLLEPSFGVASVSVFNFVVRTENASECKYSTSPLNKYDSIDNPNQIFSTEDDYDHKIEEFTLNTPDKYETSIYVICKTKDNNYINDGFAEEIKLSVDRTPPNMISLIADPSPVIERLEVKLIAETDDKTICRFKSSNITLEELDSLFVDINESEFHTESSQTLTKYTTPMIEDQTGYLFFAACMNKAQWSVIDIVSFEVNLSVSNKITELSPTGHYNEDEVEIRVITNKDSTCKFGQGYLNQFPQGNEKVHFIQQENLTDGFFSLPVICTFNDASVIETVVEFTVDTEPPTSVSIKADQKTCNNESLSVEFSAQDNIHISHYVVKLLDSLNNVLFKNESNLTSIEYISNNLTLSKKYFWEIYAVDIAGNLGQAKKSSGTLILPETDKLCEENQPPIVSFVSKLTEDGIKLILNCKDDSGTCKSKYYSVIRPEESCENAILKRYYSQVLIKNESKFCFNLTDKKGLSIFDSATVKYTECSSNITCCAGKQGQVCLNNCTVVTDVDCAEDKIDSDKDGILDNKEIECGLNINLADALLDYDNDTLTNKEECLTYKTSITQKDTDGDGFDDNIEVEERTDPNDFLDYPIDDDLDTDNDGITDVKENECGLDPEDPDDASEDNDEDGLTNKYECRYGTNINKEDTDGDGYSDKVEIDKNTDPRKKSEFPKSHLFNIILFVAGITAIAFGIMFFTKGSPKKSKPTNEIKTNKSKKPLVNFNTAKKEMQKLPNEPRVKQQPAKKIVFDSELDREIRRKREELRLKEKTSIFDEFVDDSTKKPRLSPKKTSKPDQKENVFDRLDHISEEDAYEDIEKIKKRGKNKDEEE